MVARLNVRIGKTYVRQPSFSSEQAYVSSMRRTSKGIVDMLMGVIDQFEEVTPEIMVDALEPTFELSKEYCPVDTGKLVNSGYLEVTSRGKAPRAEIGYGRGGVPYYAVLVHEATWIGHQPPTRSKWLQAAVMEDLGNIYNRLAEGYAAFMGA